MRISVFARSFECSESLRDLIDRKLAYAFSRFGSDVVQTEVLLEFQQADGKSNHYRCRVIVDLKRDPQPVVCETSHAEVQKAVELAIGRAGRTVGRAMTLRNETKTSSR